MEIETKRTELIEAEFDIFIKKRLPYILRSKYYTEDDMRMISLDLFELGIEYSTEWNNCYINLPGENREVILKVSENNYHVCRYKNKCYYTIDGNKKLISINPESQWRYLNYPNCCGCQCKCQCN